MGRESGRIIVLLLKKSIVKQVLDEQKLMPRFHHKKLNRLAADIRLKPTPRTEYCSSSFSSRAGLARPHCI